MTAPRGLFVAGTDTGVGKTTVAVGLLRLLRRAGRVPIPYKPVETGCAPEPLDARRLWEAARPPTTLAETCPFPLALPAAPAAAAAAAGLRLDVAALARGGRALATRGDLLIVEGAGGLLVPIDGRATNADLATDLGLPILLVGRMSLGTINHTALTVSELRRRGLSLLGIVLVRTGASVEPHEGHNLALIETLTGIRPIGIVPHLPLDALVEPDRIADAATPALGELVSKLARD